MDIDGKINYLIGALIVVVLATSLAPTMFTNVFGLQPVYNESNASQCLQNCDALGVPVWVPTTLFVIVGAGIVFLIWKSFGQK